MSDFLDDPSALTKDKLKSALLAHNVSLPNGDQKKDVYVQLYLQNLTAQNKKSSDPPEVFSSDEELPPAPVVSNKSRSGRKATRKTDKVRPEEISVTELTNEGLKDLLLKYGLNAGPIVASTRRIYEKRLQKLLDQGPPETVAPPSEVQTDGGQNGNTDSDQYSDKEEETVAPAPVFVPDPEPKVEAEPVPVVARPVRSRGKTPVTTRTRSGLHNRDYSDMTVVKEVSVALVRIEVHSLAVPKEPKPSKRSFMSKSDRSESPKRHSSPFQSAVCNLHEDTPIEKESCGSPDTQPGKQSKITPVLSPVTPVQGPYSIQAETKQTVTVEKVSAIDQTPKTVESDVLKEIFPNENLSTPTGISATCRRPIRGAAGRPLVDSWLDESRVRHTEFRETSTSYTETCSVPRVAAVPLTASKPVAPPAVKTRARRGLPVWVQLLLLSAVTGFLFFVYQAMETNEVGLFKQSGADESTSK